MREGHLCGWDESRHNPRRTLSTHPEVKVGPQGCCIWARHCPQAWQAHNDMLVHREQLAFHHMHRLLP